MQGQGPEAGPLQSPHDPDVTYSGHKGKGYGAGGGDLPRGERHPAHHPRGGDPLEWERHRVSVPVVDGLGGRSDRTSSSDTAYGNAFDGRQPGGERRGTGEGDATGHRSASTSEWERARSPWRISPCSLPNRSVRVSSRRTWWTAHAATGKMRATFGTYLASTDGWSMHALGAMGRYPRVSIGLPCTATGGSDSR